MADLKTFFIRPLHARKMREGRVSTQLELFFDLVTVIAIASITRSLHHSMSEGHGLELMPRFIFVFLAIWWPWMNYTWFASGFDNRDGLFKILTAFIMLGYLLFASGVSHIMATMDFGYGLLGWIIMRVGLILLILRAAHYADDGLKAGCYFHACGLFVVQCIWTILYFTAHSGVLPLTENSFLMIGGLVYLVEFSIPLIATIIYPAPFNLEHLVERYGLLNIIVMGETLLSVSIAFSAFYEGGIDPAVMLNAVWSFLIVFLLWWIYFLDTKEVAEAPGKELLAWGMLHFFVFFAGAWLGASLATHMDEILHLSHITEETAIFFLGAPISIYLFGIWIVRERFHLKGTTVYILPAAAILVLISSLMALPIWVFPIILTTALLLRIKLTPIEDLNL